MIWYGSAIVWYGMVSYHWYTWYDTTEVPLGIEHLSPFKYPKQTGSKMLWGLNLGGPWKEAPFDFLIARSHTFQICYQAQQAHIFEARRIN